MLKLNTDSNFSVGFVYLTVEPQFVTSGNGCHPSDNNNNNNNIFYSIIVHVSCVVYLMVY